MARRHKAAPVSPQLMLFENNDALTAKPKKSSPYNDAIMDEFKNGGNNIVIRARAGSGKTHQLVQLVSECESSLVLAFNKNAKLEFEDRLKTSEKEVFSSILTFHGLGYRALLQRIGKPDNVSHRGDRMRSIIEEKYPTLYRDQVSCLVKMTQYARNYINQSNEMWMRALTRSGAYDLWSGEGVADAVEMAMYCMEASVCIEPGTKTIDFDDMIYVPVKQNWKLDSSSVVMIDETQDLCETQIAMAWRSRGKDARVIAVGDELQCHPGCTMVTTPKGIRRIESLRDGDLVLGWDYATNSYTSPRSIKITQREYDEWMWQIVGYGFDVHMTPNHKVMARANLDVYCAYLTLGGLNILTLRALIAMSAANPNEKIWIMNASIDEKSMTDWIQEFSSNYAWNTPEQITEWLQPNGYWDYPTLPFPASDHTTTADNIFPLYSGALCPVAFSVANHLGEWCSDYHVFGSFFTGVVYSLDVGVDHSYVADGMAVLNSIYAFRGADSEAMPRVIKALNAKELPLPITYRCAKSIVRIAARYAPDIQHREDAPEGEVHNVTPDEMRTLWRANDLVLSRKNAPLVGHCLAALKMQIPAYVQGRAEDMGIDVLLRKFDRNSGSLKDALKKAREWAEEEKQRCVELEDEEGAIAVEDRLNTLYALADGCTTSYEVVARLRRIMSDAKTDGSICFSTVHKAKGSEAERVFVLTDTFIYGHRDPVAAQEEKNLFYVAVTRAKNFLYFVRPVAC